MKPTPEQIEAANKLTEETPQYHVKAGGEICSSLLVTETEEPAELPCDCGLDEMIASFIALAEEGYAKGRSDQREADKGYEDKARREGAAKVVRAVEKRLSPVRDKDIGFDPSSVSETVPAVAADKAYNYAVRKLREAASNALRD